MRVRSLLVGALAAAFLWPGPAMATCPGDCNSDDAVQINEVVQGVAIALGQASVGTCASFDLDGDGVVSIAELLNGVNSLLAGCSATPVTPPTRTATPTAVPTDTPTPTATQNRAPERPNAMVYRTYPDQEIALPLAVDPEGGPVTCQADGSLPDGASLDGDGVLHWTPLDSQLGPLSLPFTCRDGADPPASASFVQHFRVAALDGCAMPDCAPERGCTAALPPPGEPCCAGAAIQRSGEPAAGCPEGRMVMIGRNQNPETFGRLHNCDRLRVFNSGQSSAEIRFHLRMRCLNPLNRVIVLARLETFVRGLAVNAEAAVSVEDTLQRRNLRFPVMGGGPFFDLDNAEANLTVTVRDQPAGNTATETVRVILGFGALPDLPDP
jgi:hypothetical protein